MSSIHTSFWDSWNSAKEEIARLEQYREYTVPSDLVHFQKYKKGRTVTLAEIAGDWYQTIEATVERGVQVHRFRVVDVPLPLYQQYEVDWGYLIGEKFGQQTWTIRRPLYEDLFRGQALPIVDFWVFDKTTFFEVAYDPRTGDYIGEEVAILPARVVKLAQAYQTVSSHSVDLHSFLSSVGYHSDKLAKVILPSGSS